MSEIRRKLLMQKIEQGPLPKEYQQVAYIGSTYGDYQEIDIDYIPNIHNEEYTIIAKSPYHANDNDNYYFFGCGSFGSYVHIGVFVGGNKGYYMRIRNSGGRNHTIGNAIPTSQNNNNIYTFIASYSGFFVKDTATGDIVVQYLGPYSEYTRTYDSYPLKIFTWNGGKSESHAIMEFYGFYIKDKTSNKYKVNLIPCIRKSDNKPSVYDTIRNRFFINGGTKNDFYYRL